MLADSAGWGVVLWDLTLPPHFSMCSRVPETLYSLVTSASSTYHLALPLLSSLVPDIQWSMTLAAK